MSVSAEPPPAPLVSPDTDVRDLDGFMLNVERMLASELWALSSGDEFKAAFALWMRAWKQFPAGSLPDDDRVLAAFSGAGNKWAKVRAMALRGFVKCTDGRLYHRVLAAEAMRSYGWKMTSRKKREADAERLRKWRASHAETPVDTPIETTDETHFVAEGQDRTGQDRKEEVRKYPPTTNSSMSRDDDATSPVVVVVQGFLRLHAEHFPSDERLRAKFADAKLRADATEFLDAGGTPGLILPTIAAAMAEFARKGQPAPATIRFCGRSILDAIALAKPQETANGEAKQAEADGSSGRVERVVARLAARSGQGISRVPNGDADHPLPAVPGG